tara:strand:+ start:598 stop:1380 length:783 start_codon:yes stop_codon:yes gene_type:complete
MRLKYLITDESELPTDDNMRGLYQKDGESWILQVDGVVPKKTHDTFRDANIDLKRKLEAFGALTPEEAAEAAKLKRKVVDLETQITGDKDKVDKLVQQRVGEMRDVHEKERTALQGSLDKANGSLDTLTIDRDLVEAGRKFGLRDTASSDLIGRGRSIFKRGADGNVVAMEADGTVKFGPSGDPLTAEQFVHGLTTEAAHLFDPSKGSGSGGSGTGGNGGTGRNPWKAKTFHLTEQARMVKENPQLAKQMAAEVGKTLAI